MQDAMKLKPAPRLGGASVAVAALVICALLSAGCSWTFVYRAPDTAGPGEHVECTESPAPAHLDVAMAVLYPAAAALRLALGDVEVTNETTGETEINEAPPAALLLGVSAAVAAVFGLSAWTGYRQTAHCREVLRVVRAFRSAVTDESP